MKAAESPSGIDRILPALVAVVSIAAAPLLFGHTANEFETTAYYREQIDRMSADEHDLLLRNLHRFNEMSEPDRAKIRQLHQQVTQDQELYQTVRQFHAWLPKLDPQDSFELNQFDDPRARAQRVSELVDTSSFPVPLPPPLAKSLGQAALRIRFEDFQHMKIVVQQHLSARVRERRFSEEDADRRGLGDAQQRGVPRGVEFVRELSTLAGQLISKLSDAELRQRINKLPAPRQRDDPRLMVSLGILWHGLNAQSAARATDEQLETAFMKLSAQARQAVLQMEPHEARTRLYRELVADVDRPLFERLQRFRHQFRRSFRWRPRGGSSEQLRRRRPPA